jgi:hypothetical protein
MTTTYQKLLNKIEAFCNAHLQIKKYKGEFKEQMPNFATLDEKYPIVFVVPNGDTEGLELNQFTLEVYCLDIIQKDRANINTIVSDCHLILKDLYLYFKDGTDLEVDVIGDPTMTPLNNDLLDYAAGWVMTITFEVEGYTVCAIPMNPIPHFVPTCEDATVENSDESYTASVASGGTLVLPDITVTDSDGSTFTQPAVTNVVCTFNPPCDDATYSITDDSLNVLYSGSIPSGGNLDQVIQDSTVSITDDSLNVLHTVSVNAQGSASQVIADSTAVLKTTSNVTLSTTSINAQASADITAPDTSIEVNGVAEGSVVAGSTVDVITNIVPSSSSLSGSNLTLTFTKELFWELNYNGTDDIIFIPATVNNVGTLTSGTGSNVGTIDVSTDGVTYAALTFPFTPVNGTTYYFKRSTATVSGVYTMTGTYA